MSDPLHDTRLVLPADGQRSFEELREEFREANLQRVRAMTRPYDVAIAIGKDAEGNPIYNRVKLGGFRTTAEEGHVHSGFDPKAGAGMYPKFAGEIPDIEGDARRMEAHIGGTFFIQEGAGLDRELRDLARDASALALHEGVKYSKGMDVPGAECPTCNSKADFLFPESTTWRFHCASCGHNFTTPKKERNANPEEDNTHDADSDNATSDATT